MTARSEALALLLVWVALSAQTKAVQRPPQALNPPAKPPIATVEATPNPVGVNSAFILRVNITPAVRGPLQYEVYADGARLTHCPTDSPECQWTASIPGAYALHAIVRRPALGQGRGGSPGLTIDGPRSILTVQPAPIVTPTPPAKPPIATVEATPNPVGVNSPFTLRVNITPAVRGPLQYEVYADGARLTHCPTDSPECQWTASIPGAYALHAIVRRPALGQGRGGSPGLTIDGPRSILTVQPAPIVTPTPPAKPPIATVEATPNPVGVNSPFTLRVNITPAVRGPLQYEVYADGARLTHCPMDSPECQWTASIPGAYALHAIVRRPALGQGRGGSPGLTIDGPRSILTVQPAPIVTPTPPAKPPIATVEATPNPVGVNSPFTLRVNITPAVRGPLQYEVYADGARLTHCPTDSPECQWTASIPGAYALHAIVRRPALGQGRGGSPGLTIDGPRSILTVQPAPIVTPTPPATASPALGQAGASATAAIVVSRAFPWIWIYFVVGILGVAVAVWVFKRPPPIPATSPPRTPHEPLLVPAATFHPHPTDALRFEPSKGNGIRLEVHYEPNVASLSYTPRVRISEEQS